MYAPMWLHQLHQRFFSSCRAGARRKRQSPRSCRSGRLHLDALEDRITPTTLTPTPFAADGNNSLSGTIETPVAPALLSMLRPSSPQFQPLLSLFIDGASLEVTNLTHEYEEYGNEIVSYQLDQSLGEPQSSQPSAAAVQFNNAALGWIRLLYQIRGNDSFSPLAVEADIFANLPNAGPLGPLALLNGAQVVDYTVPHSEPPPPLPAGTANL